MFLFIIPFLFHPKGLSESREGELVEVEKWQLERVPSLEIDSASPACEAATAHAIATLLEMSTKVITVRYVGEKRSSATGQFSLPRRAKP